MLKGDHYFTLYPFRVPLLPQAFQPFHYILCHYSLFSLHVRRQLSLHYLVFKVNSECRAVFLFVEGHFRGQKRASVGSKEGSPFGREKASVAERIQIIFQIQYLHFRFIILASVYSKSHTNLPCGTLAKL